MNTIINFGGKLAEPIIVENGVKQGGILVPTLFSLHFAMVFKLALKDCHNGVYIQYRISGKLFNVRYLGADTKVSMNLICDLLYADDCDLVTHRG